MDFLHNLYTPEGLKELIKWGGPLLLFCIVYAETGLMVGFFLPGDSLLVTAGVFAAGGLLAMNIWLLILLLCVAAIAGDNTGYWIGRKAGPSLFARPDSKLFKRKRLEQAQSFYDRHGPKTVVIARFVPIVRTFAPIVAGIAEMPYRRFLPFSIGGGISWISSMLLLGYFVGNQFPGMAKHIDKVVIVVVLLSLLPMVFHALKERKNQAPETAAPDETALPFSDGAR